MKKLIIITAIILIISTTCLGKNGENISKPKQEAINLVEKSLKAMGGKEKLHSLKSVTFDGIGHNFAVEQSERPEGPFLVAYNQIKETRDLEKNRLKRTTKMRQLQLPNWFEMSLTVADGVAVYKSRGRDFPGRAIEVQDAEIKLALAPEKVLFTALSANDLRIDEPQFIQKVKQNTIRFSYNNFPVIIYFNSFTNLPTAVEIISASNQDFFWSIWGDVKIRTYYSLWTLKQGGIRYPQQWDIKKNDYPVESFTITDLKFNTLIDAKAFEISDSIRKAFASMKAQNVNELALGVPNRPASEIVPNIIEIPGSWDIAFVQQEDGILIIETPISSGYSEKAIKEAKKRFPNKKIKGVITTSDAFPHIGGIREYVAQSIPIYALDLNKSILQNIINSPRSIYPDNLARNKKSPIFNFISNKTVVGKGKNRLEIYPIRSESGERMMMIYFPEHKLLYSSDLIQKLRNGKFFLPQYLSEVMQAVEREKLDVISVFGMHLSKTPWTEVIGAVAKQKSTKETISK